MKALVLFSGGIDSTTALGLAIKKYGKDQVIALSVSYGQKHDKEIRAAIAVTEYYGVEHLFTASTVHGRNSRGELRRADFKNKWR